MKLFLKQNKAYLIVVVIFLVAILFILNLFLHFYKNNEASFIEEGKNHQLILAKQISLGLKSYFDRKTESLKNFKGNTRNISFYDKNTKLVYSSSETCPEEFVQLKRKWGQVTKYQNKIFFTEENKEDREFVKKCKYEDRTFLLIYPLWQDKPDKEFIGAVVFNINLNKVFKNEFGLTKLPDSAFVYIICEDGCLVYHSTHPEMYFNSIFKPEKSCLNCHYSFDLQKEILKGKKGTANYKVKNGVEMLVAYYPLKAVDKRWAVVASIPVNNILKPLNNSKKDFSLIIALILLVSTIFLIIFISLIYKSTKYKLQFEKMMAETSKQIQYMQIIETSIDGFFMMDADGYIRDVNEAFSKMVEYSRDELLKMHISQLEVKETAEETKEHIAKVLQQGFDIFETKHKTKSGKIIDLEISTKTIFENEKKYFFVFARDITKRKQVEKELKDSERRFKAIVDGTNDLVLLTDNEGEFLLINKKVERVTGYSFSELMGKKIQDFIFENDLDYASTEIKKVLEGGFSQFEIRIRAKNDSLIYLQINASTLYYDYPEIDEGILSLILYSARDITLERELESQLKQVQKLDSIGMIAGEVAHDFNNILTVIIGFNQLALAKLELGSDIYNKLKQVEKAAERAAALTRKLLAFSRKQVIELKYLDINKVIKDYLQFLQQSIRENVELKFIAGENITTIKADVNQIEQVLLNLCVNARDAMPEGGRIIIESKNIFIDEEYCKHHLEAKPGSFVLLTISDNGSGMSKKTLQRIFEPFFTTKKIGEGTGLGLAVIYGIVKQHNGFVNVYSEVKKGTTFKIYLPAVEEKISEDNKQNNIENSNEGNETILVVEDNEMPLALIEAVLKNKGYKVLLAENGKKALEIFQKNKEKIDLIITDLIMPVMGGIELYDEIKKINAEMKFIFTSGYGEETSNFKEIHELKVAYLNKPISPNELLAKVREVLNG